MTGSTSSDAADLEAYLSDRLGETVTDTAVLHDGLNLVIRIATAESDDGYVLRQPNEMRKTDLFNDPRTEYEILRRLQDAAVPTAEPVLFCDDPSVFDGPFAVLTYVEGEEIPWEEDVPERFRDPDSRRRVGEGLVDALADLHSVEADRFEDVCDHLSVERAIESSVDRLDRATDVTGHEIPRLWEVAEWLRDNVPDESGTALIHGDYKPDNVFLAGETAPEVAAVADWETATLGDPLTDLGYFLFYWREADDPRSSLAHLVEKHGEGEPIREVRERDDHGFWTFTGLPGSPTRRELVDRYERRTGIEFEHHRFYRARAALSLAGVWEDLYRLQVEAGDVDPGWEPHIEYVGTIAREIIDGDRPL